METKATHPVTTRFLLACDYLIDNELEKSKTSIAKKIANQPGLISEIETRGRDITITQLWNFIREYNINPGYILNENETIVLQEEKDKITSHIPLSHPIDSEDFDYLQAGIDCMRKLPEEFQGEAFIVLNKYETEIARLKTRLISTRSELEKVSGMLVNRDELVISLQDRLITYLEKNQD